jgi:hypothetical protein
MPAAARHFVVVYEKGQSKRKVHVWLGLRRPPKSPAELEETVVVYADATDRGRELLSEGYLPAKVVEKRVKGPSFS